MEGFIDITGVDLRALVREAYDLSRPQGMGFLHFTPGALPEDQVEHIVTTPRVAVGGGLSLDYVNGRAVKMLVRTQQDGRQFIRNSWYDHSAEDLRTLLRRLGMPEKASEVIEQQF